ncbi:Homeodomain-like protein, partial [Cytidiella melzeri]
MPSHLSDDLRARMVSWRENDGMSAVEIACLAECSERTVYEVLRTWREYGELHDPFIHPRGRPRTLNAGDLQYIVSQITEHPTLYLDEIQHLLYEHRNID